MTTQKEVKVKQTRDQWLKSLIHFNNEGEMKPFSKRLLVPGDLQHIVEEAAHWYFTSTGPKDLRFTVEGKEIISFNFEPKYADTSFRVLNALVRNGVTMLAAQTEQVEEEPIKEPKEVNQESSTEQVETPLVLEKPKETPVKLTALQKASLIISEFKDPLAGAVVNKFTPEFYAHLIFCVDGKLVMQLFDPTSPECEDDYNQLFTALTGAYLDELDSGKISLDLVSTFLSEREDILTRFFNALRVLTDDLHLFERRRERPLVKEPEQHRENRERTSTIYARGRGPAEEQTNDRRRRNSERLFDRDDRR